MSEQNEEVLERFEELDEQISELEQEMNEGAELPLEPTLQRSMAIVDALLRAYARHQGKEIPPGSEPPDGESLLATQKAFVKGEPSLTAVRDNVRELVYYRNCIDMDRRDALPARPERMAVRTTRHIYLYLRTRLIKESHQDAKPLRPM